MAGNRPSCWKDGTLEDALNLPARHDDCDWCRDRARSCRAYGPDMNPPTDWPDECFGCVRKLLAVMEQQGKAAPLPHRVGRRAAA
jgi:hypothetical protein